MKILTFPLLASVPPTVVKIPHSFSPRQLSPPHLALWGLKGLHSFFVWNILSFLETQTAFLQQFIIALGNFSTGIHSIILNVLILQFTKVESSIA